MEALSSDNSGPIGAKDERNEITQTCRELVADVLRILDSYFPPDRKLGELQRINREVIRTFTGECVLATVANISDPERKIAFRENPIEASNVIKYAVEMTDFEESIKQNLLERVRSLTEADIEAISPAIVKLQLLEPSSSTRVFRQAIFNQPAQDPDLIMADALIKLASDKIM